MGLSLPARCYIWGVVLAALAILVGWLVAWEGPAPTAWAAPNR